MSVTAPAPPAPPQKQPPPAPPAAPQPQDTHAILAAIVLVLAANTTTAVTLSVLTTLLAPLGITAIAVTQALSLLGPIGPEPLPTAARFTRSAEFVYRAQYILAAVKRLSAGGSVTLERQYAAQHVAAHKARQGAAAAIDATVAQSGPRLIWTARMDIRTTAGCREADGQAFTVDRPLTVEGVRCFPGQVHPSCRCIGLPA